MQALRYYLAYKLSSREIEGIFAARNIHFDHSKQNRWVIKYAPQLEANFRMKKRRESGSWRMEETYIKFKSQGVYYYRAVDKFGAVINFLLDHYKTSEESAAHAFFSLKLLPNMVCWKKWSLIHVKPMQQR